jgi:hypothetical protein
LLAEVRTAVDGGALEIGIDLLGLEYVLAALIGQFFTAPRAWE